jgi:hypothetical protein
MQLEAQLHEKKVEAVFTDKLKDWLAEKGFDPLMGARPMARLIQDTIRSALADELLFGRLANGGRVTIDLDGDKKVQAGLRRGGRAGRLIRPLQPATAATMPPFSFGSCKWISRPPISATNTKTRCVPARCACSSRC